MGAIKPIQLIESLFQSQNGLILVLRSYNNNTFTTKFQSQNGLILVNPKIDLTHSDVRFQSQNGLILVYHIVSIFRQGYHFNPKMV